MRLYKYHLLLYSFYKEFGESIFYGKQADVAKLKHKIVETTNLRTTALMHKKLLRWAKADEVKEQLKEYDLRRSYRIITKEGLKICKWIDDNPKEITKVLLKS